MHWNSATINEILYNKLLKAVTNTSLHTNNIQYTILANDRKLCKLDVL